jgi:hypothetical protein
MKEQNKVNGNNYQIRRRKKKQIISIVTHFYKEENFN